MAFSLRFKKSEIGLEVVFLILIFLIFALVLIFSRYIFNDINTDFQAETDLYNESKEVMSDMESRSSSVFDGLFLFLFVLLWGAVIVSAFFMESHPLLFIFSIIILIFVLFVGAALSNAFIEIGEDSELSSIISTELPITNWIMQNLVLVVLSIGISVGAMVYIKSR